MKQDVGGAGTGRDGASEDGADGYGDGSAEIIAACIEVHRHLGPGLLEGVYLDSLEHELTLRGIRVERQVPVRILYKGARLRPPLRIDLLVERRLIIEVKSIDQLIPVHHAQVATYLKLTGLSTALLVNFNVTLLRKGLRRVSNGGARQL